jgi:acetyl-CoA synthetase
VPDDKRGQVVKAFVVVDCAGSDELTKELQDFTRQRLAQHEFPRIVEYVSELPKNPAGKVHRKKLRDMEAEKAAAAIN